MKKRFLTLILTLTAMLTCIFGLTACGDKCGDKEVSFKLNFVVDNEIYATIDTSGDEVIALPENPKKENHSFDGWYWDKDTWQTPFTANSLLDAPLSSDMSVYAKFSINTIQDVTFEDVETTYDGTEKTIAVSNLPNGASVVYDKINTYTNVGEYTVTATISQENHENLQLMATLKINKAAYDMSGVVFADKAVTYNGESHSITATNLPDGVTVEYTGNNQTNADEYTITATFTGDSANYEPIADKTATLTINKASVSKPAQDSTSFVYNSNEQTYQLAENSLYTISGNKQINAGNHTVTISLNDKNNYQWNDETATDLSYSFNIAKAVYDMSVVVFADKTVTYNGNAYSIEAQNVPSGLSVSYTGNDRTNVEAYTVTATFTDTTGNYENPENMTATLVINKATITGITFTDKTVTYDTKTHALAIDGNLPACVKVTYKNNDKVNANTYTVTASFEDTSGNYIVPNDMSAKLIINKATVSGISFENKTFTYNGTKRSLEINGTLPEEVTVSYANNGKINANTYNVTATFTCETENYVVPDDMTAVLTIKKAVYDMANVTFENKTVTYDGKVHSLAVSDNLPDGVTVTYENNDKISANQYIVTAIFTGDSINYYSIDDMQAMLTINKATYDMSSVSFVGGRFTYDGTQKFIYVTGELPDGVTVNYNNNGKINANTYTVTATFTGDTENYNKLPDWTASLIIDKATYDMSGVSFKNQTFTYDTTVKNTLITGTLPNGVEVSYVGNSKTDVGTYSVTAKFNGDSNNYHLIDDMTATLKINQAVPYIKEVYCNQSLNVYSTVELFADTDVAGMITLDNGQMLALGYKTYSWTFVPEDTHNYMNATGTVGLTVCALVSYYNDGVLFDSQNIVLNNSATVPTGTPLRADKNGLRYTFSHWSIEENGAEYNFTNAIMEDLNLYAVYDSEEIVYAINYYDTKGVEHDNILTYTISTEYTLSDLEKEHYIFNGWVDEDGNEVTKIDKGTFGTLNLYATWTIIEYSIKYELGYFDVKNANNPSFYTVEDSLTFVSATYDKYHTFVGWYTDEALTIQKTSIYVGESGTMTLYAKWNFSGKYISSVAELQSVAYNLSGAYELTKNIDLSGITWEPLGDETNPFTGHFNGADYSILNFEKVSNRKDVGLFGYSKGTIKNLNISVNWGGGSTISGQNIGALVGHQYMNGQVSNCHVTGVMNIRSGYGDYLDECFGGLIGNNETGSISYCSSNIEMTANYSGNIGGLIGENTGTVNNCFSKGTIRETINKTPTSNVGTSYMGGLIGYNCSIIRNSYSACVVWESSSSDYTGGIAGVDYGGRYINCYFIGRASYGIVNTKNPNVISSSGSSQRYLDNCFALGTLCISLMTEINNCYSYSDSDYATNLANFKSRSFILNVLGWSETDWYLEDGEYPKLRFELK